MSEKRKHGSAFQVGPANLPDGTRKRKADRIKQALIDRAKIRQDFEKTKKRRLQEEQDTEEVLRRDVYEEAEDDDTPKADVSAAPHPDRQALIDGTAEPPQHEDDGDYQSRRRDRGQRRPRENPYAKQMSWAQRQKEEADRRTEERETANRQREEKIKDREKMQRMIWKAKRPTLDGKRKLGRESEFLLKKVKRLVNG
jgi:hypothetical protein